MLPKSRASRSTGAVGFGILAHSNRIVRRITGHTPTAYQRVLRQEGSSQSWQADGGPA
jgi:hypothetical protein